MGTRLTLGGWVCDGVCVMVCVCVCLTRYACVRRMVYGCAGEGYFVGKEEKEGGGRRGGRGGGGGTSEEDVCVTDTLAI